MLCQAILTQHAQQLTAAGIDHVVGEAVSCLVTPKHQPAPQVAKCRSLRVGCRPTESCWPCTRAVDMTNLPDYDQTSDAIQLRPFEVLVEVLPLAACFFLSCCAPSGLLNLTSGVNVCLLAMASIGHGKAGRCRMLADMSSLSADLGGAAGSGH